MARKLVIEADNCIKQSKVEEAIHRKYKNMDMQMVDWKSWTSTAFSFFNNYSFNNYIDIFL